MTKSLFLSTALATGLALTGFMQPAEAVAPVPALDRSAAQSALVQEAGWRCGPRRCHWVPGFRGPLPRFALGWGPPHLAHCYWKRGILGKWKYKCND